MAERDSPGFHRVHHLLWECDARMILLADDVFGDGELTLSLAGTLDMVGTWPGSTVAELSRRGPKTQQAVSQLVARLEKLGYVERRLRPGRGVGLYLTASGEAARTEGNEREEELEERLLELLGEDIYTQLGELLEKARDRLRDRT
jgi:DNA-binding MarR family transcriptional regulator